MFNKLKQDVYKTKSDKNNPERQRTDSANSQTSIPMSGFETVDLFPPNKDSNPTVVYSRSSVNFSGGEDDEDDSDSVSVISSLCPSGPEVTAESQAKYTRVYRLARGYKAQVDKLKDSYKQIETDRDHLRNLLDTNHAKASRQIDELREQCELGQKAKQDVEVNYNLLLSEKDEFIHVLRLQVSLLKEGKDLPPDLEEKISSGQQQHLKHQLLIEGENRQLKSELEDLKEQLRVTTLRLEERIVDHNELQKASYQFESQANQKSTENAQLLTELTDANLSCSALEDQVRGLKAQLVDTQARLDLELVQTTNQLNNLRNDLRRKQEECTELHAQLNQHSSQNELNESESAALQQLRTEQGVLYENVAHCLTQLSDSFHFVENPIVSNFSEAVHQLAKTIDQSIHQFEELKTQNSNLKQSLDDERLRRDNLLEADQIQSESLQQLDDLRHQLSVCEQINKETEARCSKLTEESIRIQQLYDRQKVDYESTVNRLSNMEIENNTMRTQLDRTEKQLDASSQRSDAMRDQLTKLQAHLANLHKETVGFQSELKILRSDWSSFESSDLRPTLNLLQQVESYLACQSHQESVDRREYDDQTQQHRIRIEELESALNFSQSEYARLNADSEETRQKLEQSFTAQNLSLTRELESTRMESGELQRSSVERIEKLECELRTSQREANRDGIVQQLESELSLLVTNLIDHRMDTRLGDLSAVVCDSSDRLDMILEQIREVFASRKDLKLELCAMEKTEASLSRDLETTQGLNSAQASEIEKLRNDQNAIIEYLNCIATNIKHQLDHLHELCRTGLDQLPSINGGDIAAWKVMNLDAMHNRLDNLHNLMDQSDHMYPVLALPPPLETGEVGQLAEMYQQLNDLGQTLRTAISNRLAWIAQCCDQIQHERDDFTLSQSTQEDRIGQLQSAHTELSKMRLELGQLQTNVEKASADLSRKEDQLVQLKSALDETKQKDQTIINDLVNSRRVALETRIERAQDWLSRLTDPDASLKDNLTQIGELISELQVNPSATAHFDEIEKRLNAFSKYAGQLKSDQDRLEVEDSLKQMNDHFEQLQSDYDLIRQSRDGAVNECSTVKRQIEQLQSDLEVKRHVIEEHCNIIDSLRSELTQMESEKDRLVQESELQTNTIKNLHGELDNLRQTSDQHTTELESVRSQLSCQLTEEKSKSNLQLLKLSEQHQTAMESASSDYDVKEGQLKKQINDLKNRLKKALQDAEQLRKSVTAAAAREVELNDKLTAVQIQLTKQVPLEQHHEENMASIVVHPHIEQDIVVKSAPSNLLEDALERHQTEIEQLKAEHASHVKDMLQQYTQKFNDREVELRVQFDRQIEALRSSTDESLKSKDEAVKNLAEQLRVVEGRNTHLKTKLQEFECITAPDLNQSRELEAKLTLAEKELSILRQQVIDMQSDLHEQQQTNRKPASTSSTDDRSELVEIPLEPVSNPYTTQTTAVVHHSPLVVQTSIPSSFTTPFEIAKSTDWVQRLRAEICNTKSIDELHPAIRSNRYISTVTHQDYEALQLHNADLQAQLHQLALEFESLQSRCAACGPARRSLASPSVNATVTTRTYPTHSPVTPFSPSLTGVQELVEYEYLKNVLFEYMLGRETSVLAKVICTIMRFSSDQTNRVLQYEDMKSRTWIIQTND